MAATPVPEMLTVNQTVAKLHDCGCGVSEHALRRWIKERRFPVVNTGKKVLINWAVLMRFLNCE